MMNKIILGLLSKKDLTVYDIKILMDKSISKFYSSSYGSINPAIKKLEQQDLITCTESIEKSRLKKTYSITKEGRKEFAKWIAEPITQGRIKDEVLVRIFFLGDTDKDTQESILTDYLEELSAEKKSLEAMKKEVLERELDVDQNNKVKFQVSTLQFGIDYLNFKENWFKKLLKNL